MKPGLINANALRIPLAAESVHMIAVSPPYWGLRDYQTGVWEGGDAECDHVAGQIRTGLGLAALGERFAGGGHKQAEVRPILYKDECKKCGAVRTDAQLGQEPLHDCLAWAREEEPCGRCFVCSMRALAREAWRVLRRDGTFWLNLGDTYVANRGYQVPDSKHTDVGNNAGMKVPPGLKPKDLAMIPARVALALQADGWWLRSDIIWSKTNPMSESVNGWRWERHQDCDGCAKCEKHDGYVLRQGSWRPTKSHEYVFMFAKSEDYYCDKYAVTEPMAFASAGRLSRAVGAGHKNINGAPGQVPHSMNQPRPNVNKSKYANSGDMAGGGSTFKNGHSGYYDAEGNLTCDPDVGRNKWTVWTLPTHGYPGSHFAVWPPALVEPMIKAGTSERGVCPHCGAPWARVINSGEPTAAPGNPNAVLPYGAGSGHSNGQGSTTLHMVRPMSTTDWRATCECPDHDPAPAIVLDICAGSGTTLQVARKLGRHGVGLDISFDYLRDEAKSRLGLDVLEAWESGEFAPPRRAKGKSVSVAQMSLLEAV